MLEIVHALTRAKRIRRPIVRLPGSNGMLKAGGSSPAVTGLVRAAGSVGAGAGPYGARATTSRAAPSRRRTRRRGSRVGRRVDPTRESPGTISDVVDAVSARLRPTRST
jgi:hypothetical protein